MNTRRNSLNNAGGNSQLDVDANASQLALPPQASQALQAHPLLPVDTGFEPSIEYLKANGVYVSKDQ